MCSSYAESLRQRLNDIGLMTEIVVIRADSNIAVIHGAIQDAARRCIMFACVINEQNAIHHSLTVNILVGQQQGSKFFLG